MVNEHFCAHATKRNESTNTGAQVQIPSYASGSNNTRCHFKCMKVTVLQIPINKEVSYSVKGDLA